MSKVKFEVTKIHCQRETRGEWGRDEIYCVAIPVIGKTQDDTIDFHQIDPSKIDGRVLPGTVSTVKNRVKNGNVWKPAMEPLEIDTGDDTALCILFVLFEEDDGKIRKELMEKFSKGTWPIDLPNDPDYNGMVEKIVDRFSEDIIATVGERWPRVVLAILKSALVVLPNIIKELRKDDIIDTQVIGYDLLDKDSCYLPREYLLTGRGGKYKVGMQLSECD